MSQHFLEPEAQQIADATAKPPYFYDLTPEAARKVLDDIQAMPAPKLDVDEKWITVTADVGDVRVRIVKPVGSTGPLPDDPLRPRRRLGPRQRRRPTTGSSASSPSASTPPSSSSSTTARPRRGTRSPSSRPTPPPGGSRRQGPPTGSTRPGSPSPATRSAATWPPR